MVAMFVPPNGTNDFEAPILCVYSEIYQWFARFLASHIFSKLESSPYLFFDKVSHASICVVVHCHISVYVPAIFPSIPWYLTAEVSFSQELVVG